MRNLIIAAVACTVIAGTLSKADDRLPDNALPLSKILTTLEEQGFSSVVEAKFDDAAWEVECLKGTEGVELTIDPTNGKILSQHPERIHSKPAANQKSALEIVKMLEADGHSPILEIEWERTYWEVEIQSTKGKRELHLAPDTGKIIAEKAKS